MFGCANRKAGRPPVLSEAERRRRILSAAEAVFIEKGYAASSMDDVVRRCGMSKKTVYQAFGTKENLFSDLIVQAMSDMPDLTVSESVTPVDGREVLRRVLRHLAGTILNPHKIALTRLVIAESSAAPELAAAFHEKGIGRAQSVIADAIEQLQAHRLLIPCDNRELCRILCGAVVGDWAIVALIGRAPPPSEPEIASRIERVLDFVQPIFDTDGSRESRLPKREPAP